MAFPERGIHKCKQVGKEAMSKIFCIIANQVMCFKKY